MNHQANMRVFYLFPEHPLEIWIVYYKFKGKLLFIMAVCISLNAYLISLEF